MAELGLVIVGPHAAALKIEVGEEIPVLRVRSDAILPLDEDLPAMVGYAASGTFHGPDADRYQLLDEQAMRSETAMLWACAQVQSAGIAQAAGQWDRILVVSWVDEPGLIPTVRALVTLKRPVTVLLGGDPTMSSTSGLRRNHVVLAELLRHEGIAAVIHNHEPDAVIDVAMDAARNPPRRPGGRTKPVDLGPALDLPPTWCMPSAPAAFHELVHVPMGHSSGLARLAVDVAAWRALHELVHGPPVDVGLEGNTGARGRLPDGDVHELVQKAVFKALDSVVLRGTEPLVEQLGRALRPVLRRFEELLDAVTEVERARLAHVRAFTAAGIHYTVQSLAARLDAIRDPYPSELVAEVEALLRGEGPDVDAPVHVTEWRRAFAGIPSCVVPEGQPGAKVARSLVAERLELFRAEFATAIASRLDRLVQRARDPEAPPSTRELRALRQRAERVRDAIDQVLERLEGRIDAGCEQATRDDRFVRWSCPEGKALRQLLLNRVVSLPAGPELDRLASEAVSRRALGMADDNDFELYLAELARELHDLPDRVAGDPNLVPTYESVLLLLLQGRDPPVLRQAIARSASTEVELHLERPVEPALMNWLTATGMLVVVAPRLKTCAIYWQRAEHLSDPAHELRRRAASEHRLADLLLPPPEGDTVATLVALVRSAVTLLVGIVLGEVAVRRREGLSVHELHAPGLELPPRTVLPHGAVHVLANDADLLARLRRRVERRIAELDLQPDAQETVKKLIELATLGPSPTLAAQIGLYGARFEHLEHPIHAMLQQHAEQALASMVDVLGALEVSRTSTPPQRRALLDVQQLGPSGG